MFPDNSVTHLQLIDIVDDIPIPCRVHVLGAEAETIFARAPATGKICIADLTSNGTYWREPHGVSVLLGERGDPHGMVERALTDALETRCPDGIPMQIWEPNRDPSDIFPIHDLVNLSLVRLVFAHRFISRTDRVCTRVKIQLEPGEIAGWHKPGLNWRLKTRQGSVPLPQPAHPCPIDTIPSDRPLLALRAAADQEMPLEAVSLGCSEN